MGPQDDERLRVRVLAGRILLEHPPPDQLTEQALRGLWPEVGAPKPEGAPDRSNDPDERDLGHHGDEEQLPAEIREEIPLAPSLATLRFCPIALCMNQPRVRRVYTTPTVLGESA